MIMSMQKRARLWVAFLMASIAAEFAGRMMSGVPLMLLHIADFLMSAIMTGLGIVWIAQWLFQKRRDDKDQQSDQSATLVPWSTSENRHKQTRKPSPP